MDKNLVIPGVMVQVKAPASFPSWMPLNWVKYIKDSDGKVLKVSSSPKTGKEYRWNSASHLTYFVELYQRSDWLFAVDWLESPAGIKVPCNCPMKIIMAQGCIDKDHT